MEKHVCEKIKSCQRGLNDCIDEGGIVAYFGSIRHRIPVASRQSKAATPYPTQNIFWSVFWSVGKWRKTGTIQNQRKNYCACVFSYVLTLRMQYLLIMKDNLCVLLPSKHSVKQYSKTPNVTALIIALPLQYLQHKTMSEQLLRKNIQKTVH